MGFRALIFGATGFGGGELMRYLAVHPHCEAVRGVSRRAGLKIAEAHPHLAGIYPGEFDAEPDWGWLREAEFPVVFAALPHGEFAALRDQVPAEALIIDLSQDFRLDPDWVYGLPEWNRDRVRTARRIANPGCFATAIQLGLLALGPEDAPISVTALTGSSGSGASPSQTTHHPTRAHDLRSYKTLAHQHQAEINRHAGAGFEVAFVPISAPLVRGIYAVIQGLGGGVADRVRARFEGERLVRVVETARVATVAGSAFAEISVTEHAGRWAIQVALDNLGKGMATQAIQNLNLALGYEETAGLLFAASYP